MFRRREEGGGLRKNLPSLGGGVRDSVQNAGQHAPSINGGAFHFLLYDEDASLSLAIHALFKIIIAA